jgi:hypothetical protein
MKALTLKHLEMDEDHCLALGSYSRPDLEIILTRCKITSTGASALAEILRRNQGPTKLDWCEIDNLVLANGLRGNCRLKSLILRLSDNADVGNQELLAFAGALRENKGLVVLDLSYDFSVNDETWNAVCDSLKSHSTLEVLDFRVGLLLASRPVPAAVTRSRTQALIDMMKVNMSIHTIRMHSCYNEHEIFQGSVIPYLETNRFRPRVRAIQKTRSIAYRAKVLGRALLSARTNPNRFWMLLSGNVEVALFPSTTVTTTPAANLPTPAAPSAAAPSTANVAAVAAIFLPLVLWQFLLSVSLLLIVL